jgi:hypothetical protein
MFPDYCDGINRGGFLRIGSLAGLSLAEVLRLQSARGCSFRIFCRTSPPSPTTWRSSAD